MIPTKAFAKPELLILLALISYGSLGDGCSGPEIVEGPDNASILQGGNHTFWCKGIGDFIDWEINGTSVYQLSENPMFNFFPVKISDNNECVQESKLTLGTKSVPGVNTLITFTIACVMKKYHSEVATSNAYLKVHVIGKVGEVSLNSPASPEGPAVIQWKAPDVLSGSTSPLYYNITVGSSSLQTITQATTMDTNYTITSDILSPCQLYHLAVLPFQNISGYPELGIMTQTDSNYSGTPLPAIDVDFSISVKPDSAQVTVLFQVQRTSCNLQSPEKFTVTLIQYAPNGEEVVLSSEQAAIGEAHDYTLKTLLNLRQNYWASIKLENNFSSSAPKSANFSTFYVQNLTLILQEEERELIVHCGMAEGAENEHCIVKIRNQTKCVQCFSYSGTDATCSLREFTPGQYTALAYDEEYTESPAMEHEFEIPEKWNEDPTNTMPETGIDITKTATTVGSSLRIEDKRPIQTGVLVGILVSLLLLLAVVVIVMMMMVLFRKRMQKFHLHKSESAPDNVQVYHSAEDNVYIEYDNEHSAECNIEHSNESNTEHNPLWQRNAVVETTTVLESAYAQPQLIVMGTPVPTDNSSNQYRQNRSEWLNLESSSPPHTPDLALCTLHDDSS